MQVDEPIYDVSPQPHHAETRSAPPSNADKGLNPYASPAAEIGSASQVAAKDDSDCSIWTLGGSLIMRRGAELPEICIFSNDRDSIRRRSHKVVWMPAWVLLLFFAAVVPFFIAAKTRRSVTIHYSISERQSRARRRSRFIAAMLGLIGLVLAVVLFLPPVLSEFGPSRIWSVLLFLAVGLGFSGVALASNAGVPLTAKKITDEFVELSGLPSQFLAQFPAWPYPPL